MTCFSNGKDNIIKNNLFRQNPCSFQDSQNVISAWEMLEVRSQYQASVQLKFLATGLVSFPTEDYDPGHFVDEEMEVERGHCLLCGPSAGLSIDPKTLSQCFSLQAEIPP